MTLYINFLSCQLINQKASKLHICFLNVIIFCWPFLGIVFGLLLLLFEPFGPWMVVTLPVINVGTAVVGSSPKTLTQWSDHPKKLAAVHNLQIFTSILFAKWVSTCKTFWHHFHLNFVVWQKLVKNLTHIFLFAYLSEILTISLNLKFYGWMHLITQYFFVVEFECI